AGTAPNPDIPPAPDVQLRVIVAGRAQSAQREFDAADRAAREAQQRVHDLEHRLATPSPTSAGEERQK
ncbi:MAG: hypothetical protein ACRDTO_10525, partial [Mycobacterium sp.]